MNLMSIAKPATGFVFDGTLQGMIDMQQFITDSGYVLSSVSMVAASNTNMKYNVTIGYTKTSASGTSAGGGTSQLTVLNGNTLIVTPDTSVLLSYTPDQFQSNYNVVE